MQQTCTPIMTPPPSAATPPWGASTEMQQTWTWEEHHADNAEVYQQLDLGQPSAAVAASSSNDQEEKD